MAFAVIYDCHSCGKVARTVEVPTEERVSALLEAFEASTEPETCTCGGVIAPVWKEST